MPGSTSLRSLSQRASVRRVAAVLLAILALARPGESAAKGKLRLQVRQLTSHVIRNPLGDEPSYTFPMLVRLKGSRRALDGIKSVRYDLGDTWLANPKRMPEPRNGDRLSGFGERFWAGWSGERLQDAVLGRPEARPVVTATVTFRSGRTTTFSREVPFEPQKAYPFLDARPAGLAQDDATFARLRERASDRNLPRSEELSRQQEVTRARREAAIKRLVSKR